MRGLSGNISDRIWLVVSKVFIKWEGLPIPPYLVPQECGMHMETKWLETDREIKHWIIRTKVNEDFRYDLNSRIRHLLFRFTISRSRKRTGTGDAYRRTTARKTNGSYDFAKVRRSRGINSWGADVGVTLSHQRRRGTHEISFIIQ